MDWSRDLRSFVLISSRREFISSLFSFLGNNTRNRNKAILVAVILSVAIIAIHDLGPYSEYNYESQIIEISEQYEIQPDSGLVIEKNLSQYISHPAYHTVRRAVLEFNVTYLSLTTDSMENDTIFVISPFFIGTTFVPFEESNFIPAGQHFYIMLYMSPNATSSATVYYSMTYTADVLFERPPRVFLSSSLYEMLISSFKSDLRPILFIRVIIIALGLSYASKKVMEY